MIKMKHIFITEEAYAIARKNGISKKQLDNRVRYCGWSLERAIFTPIRNKRKNSTKEQKELAKKNNLSSIVIWKRMKKQGMTLEQAVSTPLLRQRKKDSQD